MLTVLECKQLCARFSKCLQEDLHNGPSGYLIRSLYFDTLDNRDFNEKQEGVEVRRKIRLRLYDPTGKVAFLEMKQKQGKNQLKRSLRINKEDAQLLCQGIYTPLLQYEEPFAAECFGLMNHRCYRPKTIVDYKRKAYVVDANSIRITVDSEISATESCFDVFSEALNTVPVFDRGLAVLEVKYNHFLLSYLRDILEVCNRNSLSVSKYCLGRSATLSMY